MRSGRGQSEIYRLATILYPRSGIAEAYRTLRANVEFSSVDAPVRTLLVTSAVPGEGKSVTACNLAVAFAQSGRRVLLVDADLRRPGVHRLFDLANDRGLTDMLRDEAVGLDSVCHRSEQANLRILTTGPLPPNPAELLGSNRMQARLTLLLESADLVVMDSPPLQAVTDAAILSSFVDGTLLVVDANRSRRRHVRKARETLTRAGAHVLGAVLNRVAARDSLEYAGYNGDAKSPSKEADPRQPGTATSPTGSAP
jgi:capsular exopolysaccharide synthesis family protein